MRSPRVPMLLCATLLVGCFAGCTKSSTRLAGEFRTILEHDLPTLDPALSTGTNSGKVVALLYSTLVTYDEVGRVVPELATSWTVADDARTYTFELRRDASFPDSRPVTSGDVAYSFERLLRPTTKSPRTWVVDRIVGAQDFAKGAADRVAGLHTPTPHRLVVTLERPFAPFLGFMAMAAASVVDRRAVERTGEGFGRTPSGSGPFTLQRWTMGDELVLVRNPRAYVKPRLERIVFKIMNEPFTYSTEFKVGNLDVIPLPFSEDAFFSSNPVWRNHILSQPGLNTYFIGMNCKKGPCTDVRIRRAICRAIDARLIVETTRRNQATLAHGPIPPGLPGYDPTFEGLPGDAAAARTLLTEAGWHQDAPLELLQDERNENLEVTQLVVSALAGVGIEVKIVSMEWGVYTSAINEGRFDLYYRSWLADYTDAENFLFPLFHSTQAGSAGNRPCYADAEVDAMIAAAQGTTDDDARVDLYRRIERRVVADAAYAFLFHKLERVVVQPWLRGFRLYPVFNSCKFTDVWLDETALNAR